MHWADPRPAWLWSADGTRLIWRNDAARLFLGRVKKWGLKLAPDAVPIKGQIARLVRLGAVGRSSLSRIQLQAGDKPVSATCSCTPLLLEDDEKALLIVGVDPIDAEVLSLRGVPLADTLAQSLFPRNLDYLVLEADGKVTGGSPAALASLQPLVAANALPEPDADGVGHLSFEGGQFTVTRLAASQRGAELLLFEPEADVEERPQTIDGIREDEGLDDDRGEAPSDQPLLPLGLAPVAPAEDATSGAGEAQWPGSELPPPTDHRLSSLFDRLAEDAELYTPLTEADEQFAGQPAVAEGASALPFGEPPLDPIAEIIVNAEAEDGLPAAPSAEQFPEAPEIASSESEPAPPETTPADEEAPPADSPATTTTWRVVGRGFVREEAGETTADVGQDAVPSAPPPTEPGESGESEAATAPAAEPPAGSETPAVADAEPVLRRELDRVSRYNFDELGRILTDRVSGGQLHTPRTDAAATGEARTTAGPARPSEGTLINLAGETFILNRLPLGILVFRDQQVLFANRALTDLTGHDSIESLRNAGLTSIFPAEDAAAVGPVTHLVRRDGLLLPVNARLQSIAWHGQAALMLSASLAETRPVHEIAVKAFAELAADLHEAGYFTADRGGVVSQVSLHGRILLGRDETDLVGQPLSALIDPAAQDELRDFLERPARFAETARPGIVFATLEPHIELTVFAEGQAGIVSGYFGFVRRREPATAAPVQREGSTINAEMLGRFSRGVRRPLNTVIGFADLIRSAAFGPIDIPRYLEYARDILDAGQEIAGLIDEIDDLTQLSSGSYAVHSDALDLTVLLDSCVMRVRGQAAARRVLVRSAVSERLPQVRADRASFTQAILNLLASAIDQSPAGGTVILSAQPNEEGGLTINVRDSAAMRGDTDERFVVFREAGATGGTMTAMHSGMGLALTRSLLAVNALTLSIDPVIGVGTLFSLAVPAELTNRPGDPDGGLPPKSS